MTMTETDIFLHFVTLWTPIYKEKAGENGSTYYNPPPSAFEILQMAREYEPPAELTNASSHTHAHVFLCKVFKIKDEVK